MSVNFSSISEIAGDRSLTIMPGPDRILLNFRGVPSSKQLDSNYLYAVKASKLKQYRNLENMSLLIFEDIPLSASFYQVSGLNIIATKDSEVFSSLKSEIQNVFDEQARINNYAYHLMSLCHQDSSAQKLLDAGYCFLNNPLLLVDTSLALTHHAGVYTGINEPVINYCLENGHFPSDFLNEMINEEFPPTDEEFPELIIMERGFTNYVTTSIVAGRIIRGNQLLGYAKLFEYNHPVTNLEKRCLIILCDFLSIALTDSLPRLPINNLQIEDFLTDVLSKRITSREAIETRTFLYHLDDIHSFQFISVKFDTQKTSTDRLHFFKRQLQNMFNISTITFFNQLIVLVVPSGSLKEHIKTLENFLATHALTAGISLSFRSFVDIFKYYSQTLACLEIGTRFNLEQVLIDYDDWKLTHLFLNFSSYCDLSDLVPKQIRILEEIDKNKGSNLVETLFTFIRCRQNITEAAAALHLHYNTMKYRITQITDLTDIDFDDYEGMYKLIIAERVLPLLQTSPTPTAF